MRRITAAAALLAVLGSAAWAQDQVAPAAPVSAAPVTLPAPRLDLVIACEERDGLSLCVRPKAPRRVKALLKEEARAYGVFNKMTRLAGMFMGRVDAAEIGDFRLRVTLDLR